MINYYYEIKDNVTVFGRVVKYLCLTDVKPPIQPWMQLHEEAHKNSSRVWLENANGVYQVHPAWHGRRGHVDPHEFTMVKLKSRVYKWWHDEDLGQPIKPNHLEVLEESGMERVIKMMAEGYTCGELSDNLCLSNDDPDEGISYSGWWKINTIRG